MYSWFKYQVLTWWDILMFWGAYSTVRFVVLLTPSQCVLVFWTQLLVVWQEYSALSLYLFIERNKIMKLNFLYNSPIFIFNLYKPFCNIALKFFIYYSSNSLLHLFLCKPKLSKNKLCNLLYGSFLSSFPFSQTDRLNSRLDLEMKKVKL